MRIGLHCPEVPGHLNPMTTLGGELAARGHDVVFLGCRMAEPIVRRAGLEFVSLGAEDELSDQLEQSFRALGKFIGTRALLQTGKLYRIQTTLVRRYLPAALDALALDGMVIDQVSPACAVEAEQRAIPYAVACNALAVYWDPLIPPPPLTWDYRNDWFGRLRNQLAKHAVLLAYRMLAGERKVGVDALKLIRGGDAALVHVSQQPPFFEYPRTSYPPRLHFTGPWHQAARDDQSIDFPWDWLDGRPLIYASMGTLQNAVPHVFRAIIDAVRDLPVQVVLSKGGSEVDVPGKVPVNVLLVEKAPQLRLLEKASLVITHAGMNTAMECLAHGVPMLCLPVTNDQPGVAKRVEYHGSGRVIPVQKVTTKRLRQELDRLRNDATYQLKADQFQADIHSRNGVALAADLIEQAFTTRQPILNTRHPVPV